MPVNACQFFYECAACKALLRPEPGDCCVFCSYGSVKCPPIQAQRFLLRVIILASRNGLLGTAEPSQGTPLSNCQ